MNKITEFVKDLSLYWHCEGRDEYVIADLRRALLSHRHPISLGEFQQFLDKAIRMRKFSVNNYEILIGLALESVDDVVDDLKLLRDELFGVTQAVGDKRPRAGQ